MLQTNCKTGETKIAGTLRDVKLELCCLLSNVLHDMVIPHGIDPLLFWTDIGAMALETLKHEELFEGNGIQKITMIIPKERGTDEQQEQ